MKTVVHNNPDIRCCHALFSERRSKTKRSLYPSIRMSFTNRRRIIRLIQDCSLPHPNTASWEMLRSNSVCSCLQIWSLAYLCQEELKEQEGFDH
ncbi:hypothetical protein C1H46_005960 [Malus baccata]|uniref:Uncharacterized protein n=1 Tax=Malus baccata TaxID=106549 RepID=A0A540NBR6_MALBA|nr:hypothetical protein C1H46_005960 [Malus baccata]